MRPLRPVLSLPHFQSRIRAVALAILFVLIGTTVTLTSIANGAALRTNSRHAALEALQLSLSPIITSGLTQPLYLTHAGDSRLFIVERAGVIRIYQGGSLLVTTFLDITDLVRDTGTEEGLLNLAFPPGFSANHHHFYVYYVNNAGDLILARYSVSSGNPNLADPNSARIVLGPGCLHFVAGSTFLDGSFGGADGGPGLDTPTGKIGLRICAAPQRRWTGHAHLSCLVPDLIFCAEMCRYCL